MNETQFISTFTLPMVNKLIKMVVNDNWSPPTECDPLITWSYEVLLKINKHYLSNFKRTFNPLNFTRWCLITRGYYVKKLRKPLITWSHEVT